MGQRMPQPTPPSSNTTPESEVRDQNDGRPETFSKLHLELIFKNLKIAEIEPEVSKFIGGDLVIKPYEIDEPYEMYGFHCNHRWYHTDEYADPTAFVPDLPKAEHLQGSNMFEKLRRLRIAIKEFQMSLLPRLACPNLSHLEIDHLSFDLNEPMTLQLSELEVLHVRQLSGCLTTNRLTFDSAKLSVLCLGDGNSMRYITFSRPDHVRHLEFDQLPGPNNFLGQFQFTFPNLEKVVCTDASHLYQVYNLPKLDFLLKRNTLKELHLFVKDAGGFRWLHAGPRTRNRSEPMRTRLIKRLVQLCSDILDTHEPRDPPLCVWIQGIALNRALVPYSGIATLLDVSMLQLHFRNRNHLAASFPHCVRLHFDWAFLFELAPALVGETRLDFRSTYPFVKELYINLPCLVAKLLLKLRDLWETEDRRSELFQTLVQLYPAPADQLQLRPAQEPRDLAQDFVDIEKRGTVPFDQRGFGFNYERNRRTQQRPNALEFHRAVLDHLRTEEPALYERVESWILEFMCENFQHLAYLNLSYNGLSQSFYDRLAVRSVLTTSVNKLVLFEEEHNPIADLSFLLAFKRLYLFDSNLFRRPSLSEPLIVDFLLQVLQTPSRCWLHLTEPWEVILIGKYPRLSRSQGVIKTRYCVQRRDAEVNITLKPHLKLKKLREALADLSADHPNQPVA